MKNEIDRWNFDMDVELSSCLKLCKQKCIMGIWHIQCLAWLLEMIMTIMVIKMVVMMMVRMTDDDDDARTNLGLPLAPGSTHDDDNAQASFETLNWG